MSDEKKQTNGDSVNVALVKAMGSPTGAHNPMPVTQHEAFLDVSQTEDNRILAAIWDRTIARADDGTRSAFARENDGRPSLSVHLAAATGIKASNLSSALKRLEEAGKIRRSEGKIWLRADVPAPNLLVPSNKNKKETEVIGSNNLNAQELMFLAHLEDTDPERFRATMAKLVAADTWAAQVFRDAQAWAREREAEVRQQVFTQSGYISTEKRGRKKKRAATAPDAFKAAVSFPQLFDQNKAEFERIARRLSVQNGKVIVIEIQKNSEHKPHPYAAEAESSRGSASSPRGKEERTATKQAELEAEQANRALKTQLKNDLASRLARAGMVKMGALTIDAGTQNNIVAVLFALAKLPKATVRTLDDVFDTIEKRAAEIVKGTRSADDVQAYLVGIVKGEFAKRSGAKDLKEQMNAAAAGKAMR